jgi:putative FmdB family regulatory protein
MPIYVYECRGCGRVAEQLLLRRDEAPDPCSCGAQDLHKLPTTASPRFVGSGWGGNQEIAGGAATIRTVQGE